MPKLITTEQFIEKAKKVHWGRYNYDLVDYQNSKIKIKIICSIHGVFEQQPSNHLNYKGCRKCGSILTGKSTQIKAKNSRQDFSHIIKPKDCSIIPLPNGIYALVDEEDYERVSQYNWNCDGRGYVSNNTVGKLHRFIMNITDPKIKIDHKFHNKLDNRKSQLRICTHAENMRNTRSNKGTSKYKGVNWFRASKKWCAEITYNRKNIKIGYFDNEKDAARAYDAKAKELHKEFAHLNFPL